MKKSKITAILSRLLLVMVLQSVNNLVLSQAPQLIPYQAIARDGNGIEVVNQNISLRFSIHENSLNGTIEWQEAQQVTSNQLGIVNTQLGAVTSLSNVNWGGGAKFLQVEMDITGGTNYLDMGTQQMMSVPYALYAETSGSVLNNGGGGNGSFTHWIGEYFQGGVICQLWKDSSGLEHGLIVSIIDVGFLDQFSLGGLTPQSQSLGLEYSIYDGQYNSSISSGGAYDLCSNYTHNGFDDWYWPSIMELTCMISNKYVIDHTLFDIPESNLLGLYGRHWYTSENSANGLNAFGEFDGSPSGAAYPMSIRAFRKF